MSKFVPVFYSMMVGWGMLTLDYHNHTIRHPDAVGSDYLVSLTTRVGGPFAMYGGNVDLAQLLPKAPQGWTRRIYDLADGTAITGVALNPAAPTQDRTTAVLRDFANSTKPDHQIAITYEKDGRYIVLRLAYDPNSRLSAIEHTSSQGGNEPDLPLGAQPYDVINGLALSQLRAAPTASQSQPDFRLFLATAGQSASLSVLTNVGDKTLHRLLRSTDGKAIGAFLKAPARTANALAEANRMQYLAAESDRG